MRPFLVTCILSAAAVVLSGCSLEYDALDESMLASELRSFEIGKPAFDPGDPLLQKRMILISGGLTFAVGQTVSQQLLWLDSQSGTEPIYLLINSNGGDGRSYQAITNMMRSIHAPVHTVNWGMCASYAATLIQSATGKRLAQKDTIFMIHDVRSNNDEFQTFYSRNQEELFKSKCSLPEDWLPLKKEYTFTADEALRYGFVDEVIEKIDL